MLKSVPWKVDSICSFLPYSKDFSGLYPELVLLGLKTEALF